jgi:hypothetical protein
VGWVGQRATAYFLQALAPVFQSLAREGTVRFTAQTLALCDCVTPGHAPKRVARADIDPHVQAPLVLLHAKLLPARGLALRRGLPCCQACIGVLAHGV